MPVAQTVQLAMPILANATPASQHLLIRLRLTPVLAQHLNT